MGAFRLLAGKALEMASSVEKDEVVSLELPAPPGWTKKVSLSPSLSLSPCLSVSL